MHDDPLKRAICLGLAPVLLVLTALLQVYRVDEQNLHPWKGGGFGMFAVAPRHRALRIIPIDKDGVGYVTPVPTRYRADEDRMLFLPTEARLRRFARTLLGEDWRLIGQELEAGKQHPVPVYDTLGHPTEAPIVIKGMRLELYEYRYDAETGELRSTVIIQVDEFLGDTP
jgi:hypothetical protein